MKANIVNIKKKEIYLYPFSVKNLMSILYPQVQLSVHTVVSPTLLEFDSYFIFLFKMSCLQLLRILLHPESVVERHHQARLSQNSWSQD